MGPRLGRVEYPLIIEVIDVDRLASMGPRLGRVEYGEFERYLKQLDQLQWGHA